MNHQKWRFCCWQVINRGVFYACFEKTMISRGLWVVGVILVSYTSCSYVHSIMKEGLVFFLLLTCFSWFPYACFFRRLLVLVVTIRFILLSLWERCLFFYPTWCRIKRLGRVCCHFVSGRDVFYFCPVLCRIKHLGCILVVSPREMFMVFSNLM